MSRIQQAGCCLETIDAVPNECTNCDFSYVIESDNTLPINCATESVIEFTMTVCNDCDARDLQIQFSSPHQRQEIIDRDLSLFPDEPVIFPPGASTEKLTSMPVFFEAEECKTFKVSTSITDFNAASFNTSVSLITPYGESGDPVQSITSSVTTFPAATVANLVNAGETAQLSTLIEQFSFLDPTVACNDHSARKIEINGILEIDEDEYCLRQYKFLMGDNAKIVIKEGINLTIEDCTFLACEDVWDAIELEENASLFVDNSRFSQATNAIRAGAGAVVHVSNSEFADNYIGIKYEGERTSGDLLVRGCNFQRETGLNETVSGVTVPNIGISVGPIQMAQVLGADNDGVITNTTFDGLLGGILSNATQLDILNASFTDLNYGINHIGASESLSSTLIVRSDPTSEPAATFTNCSTAIYARRSNVGVENIEIQNTFRGVVMYDCRSRMVVVSSSNIEANAYGVVSVLNEPAIVVVQDNNIRINNPNSSFQAGTGIFSVEVTGYPSYFFNQIRDNIINLDTGGEGMRMLGGEYHWLYNNYVYLNETNNSKGIQVEGSYRPLVSFNQVFGPDGENLTDTYGLWLEGLSDPDIECNTTTNLDKGIQFFGLNDNTDLRGNTFSGGGVGLQLGRVNGNGSISNSAIDEQVHRGNIWEGTFGSGFGAVHASTLPEWWDRSPFEVDGSDTRYLPANNVPGFLWVRNIPAQEQDIFSCPTVPPPPMLAGGGYDKPTELEEKIIEGAFIISGYETTSPEIARARLLGRWYAPTTERLESPKFQAYLSLMSGTVAEQIKTDRLALQTAFEADLGDAETIADLTGRIESIMTTARAYTSSQQRTSLLEELREYQTALTTLLSTVDDQRRAAFEGLEVTELNGVLGGNGESPFFQSSNFNTSAQENDETPYLEADAIIRDVIVREYTDELTEADSLALLLLAESCPWEQGDAVYQARALFGKLDPSRRFDGDYCGTGIVPLRQVITEKPALTVSLYPNPAGEYILMTANQSLDLSKACAVYDVYGKAITIDCLEGEENTALLEIESLLPGLYLIEVVGEDGKTTVAKFVKQ